MRSGHCIDCGILILWEDNESPKKRCTPCYRHHLTRLKISRKNRIKYNYCIDCGTEIWKNKKRCIVCKEKFFKKCNERQQKIKKIMDTKDKQANKELRDFYKRFNIRI